MENGFYFINVNIEKLIYIFDFELYLIENCFNDGKCDLVGCFWVGFIDIYGMNVVGFLYCLYYNLSVEKKVLYVNILNGIVWLFDYIYFYFIDIFIKKVVCY